MVTHIFWGHKWGHDKIGWGHDGDTGVAKKILPLSDLACRQAKFSAEGGKNKLFDGGGLYLEVMTTGRRVWRLKYRSPSGKENRLTFGEYPAVTLLQARAARQDAKDILAKGLDPAVQREIDRQVKVQAQQETFKVIASEWLDLKKAGWSSGYYDRVKNALTADVYPYIGELPISSLSGLLILNVVQRVEKRGALEMASRVLEAIGMVLKYAGGTGRLKSNPAAGLSQFLQERPPVKHRPHVSATDLPTLLQRIEAYHGRPETVFATRLMMRTFPRTSELIWAQWDEFDLDGAMWAIPSSRMKGTVMAKRTGTVHLVPLATQVVDMMRDLKSLTGRHRFVFPGQKNPATRPISNETINKALKIMGFAGEQTGHGFRGLASTLMNESGLFRPEVIEAQLSHKKDDKVEAAYNHAVYIDERTRLLQWWSDYLEKKGGASDPQSTHR